MAGLEDLFATKNDGKADLPVIAIDSKNIVRKPPEGEIVSVVAVRREELAKIYDQIDVARRAVRTADKTG